tara:strand:- start:362 stop:586 length:225 start_codon:yes stop_codon:yes gene_type:complete
MNEYEKDYENFYKFFEDRGHILMEKYDDEKDYEKGFDDLKRKYTLAPMVYHYERVKAVFGMENFKKWYDKKRIV